MCCRRRDRRQADVHWTSAFEGVDSQFLNLTKKKRHPKGWRSFWELTLILIQMHPPFEVRGCKVILGGAFYAKEGATHLITHRLKNWRSIFDNY